MFIESRGVEASDLVILLAVISDDLAASGTEGCESGGPSANMEWVESFGSSSIGNSECRSVPGRVVIHNIAEPILLR